MLTLRKVLKVLKMLKMLEGKMRANNARFLFTSRSFAQCETSLGVPIVCLAC